MSFLESLIAHIEHAGKAIDIPQNEIERFIRPQREVHVNFPIKRDDGSTEYLKGYRVQWNNDLGPYKGGIRFHHQVDIQEVRALACAMMIKCAALNIPLGGGKGGVMVDPKAYSEIEKDAIMHGFVSSLIDVLGSEKDIPAPDIGTDARRMDVFTRAYQEKMGQQDLAVVTGKSLENGGSQGRSAATGRGAWIALASVLKGANKEMPKTAIVQGFGNAGQEIARQCDENGIKVIAVSDSKGAITNLNGLNIDELIKWKDDHKTVADFPESQSIDPKTILEQSCDLLIPSALDSVITKENADQIKANTILEVANGPVDGEADTILHQKGITVIPDVLANAGGVVVSYFEWLQNRQKESWSAERVDQELTMLMQKAIDQIVVCYAGGASSLRQCTYQMALSRLQKRMST